MDDNVINILCATDDSYVPYCGIMLTSIFESNQGKKVDVYIIIDKFLSPSNERRFRRLSKRYEQKIEYVMIDKDQLSRFPTKGMDYWSIAMYYRIFAEALLPSSVKRVLYVDCDIVVCHDLLSLWDLNMMDKAVGVIQDIFTYSENIYKRLQYPEEVGYFNSGVLLMNLDYWREHHVCQQCLDFLTNHYDQLFANDQDVLNAVLWDKKMCLPLTYNFQVQFLKTYFYDQEAPALQAEIIQAKTDPAIIHYAVPIKPWNVMYYKMPYKRVWRQYKRRSPWWFLLPQLPKRKTINYLIKRFLFWPLGIMWKEEYIIDKNCNRL